MEMETEERCAHAAFLRNCRLNSRFHCRKDLRTSFVVVVGGELSRRASSKEGEEDSHSNNGGRRRGSHWSTVWSARKRTKVLMGLIKNGSVVSIRQSR